VPLVVSVSRPPQKLAGFIFFTHWKQVTNNTRLRCGQSRWPLGLRRGSAAARLLGLWVRIPPGHGCQTLVECCVLSGRSLGDSYRLWCVCATKVRVSLGKLGLSSHGEKIYSHIFWCWGGRQCYATYTKFREKWSGVVSAHQANSPTFLEGKCTNRKIFLLVR
jgi:hypothetical protein